MPRSSPGHKTGRHSSCTSTVERVTPWAFRRSIRLFRRCKAVESIVLPQAWVSVNIHEILKSFSLAIKLREHSRNQETTVPHTDTTKRSHLPSSARIVLWSPQRKHLCCKSSGWRWIFLPGGAALDEAVQDREQLTQHSDQSFYGFSSGS